LISWPILRSRLVLANVVFFDFWISLSRLPCHATRSNRDYRWLKLRLRRLAWRLCGLASLWRRTACRSAAGKIFIGDGEYIMLDE